jgi:hypothetical protein
MPHCQDLEAIVYVSKDHAVIADTQPMAAAPFSLHGLHISHACLSESCQHFQNPRGRRPIEVTQARLGFACERKPQFYCLGSSLSTISS